MSLPVTPVTQALEYHDVRVSDDHASGVVVLVMEYHHLPVPVLLDSECIVMTLELAEPCAT